MVRALAVWSINPTNGNFWDSDTVSTFGPRGWTTVATNASGTDGASGDMENPGDWGIITAQDNIQVRNVLIRRYVESEPSVSGGLEETQ